MSRLISVDGAGDGFTCGVDVVSSYILLRLMWFSCGREGLGVNDW